MFGPGSIFFSGVSGLGTGIVGAVNGTSLNSSFQVVLGGDINTTNGQLTSNRDIVGNAHQIRILNGQFRVRDTTTGLTSDIFTVTPINNITNAAGVNSVIGGSPQWKITAGNGNIDILSFNGPWSPTNVGASPVFNVLHYYGINNGISSGSYVMVNLEPTLLQGAGSTETVRGFYYHPTIISLLGSHIAFENVTGDVLVGSTSGKMGVNQNLPTAKVHIGASDGTVNNAPLKIDDGPLLAAVETNAIENNSGNLFFTTAATRYTLAKMLTASAALDFPNTLANGQSDLTIAVTGAALNDVVSIGAPAGSAAVGTFWGFVSAANTVTVRFHNTSGGAVDPAAGTFKVSVFKF